MTNIIINRNIFIIFAIKKLFLVYFPLQPFDLYLCYNEKSTQKTASKKTLQ